MEDNHAVYFTANGGRAISVAQEEPETVSIQRQITTSVGAIRDRVRKLTHGSGPFQFKPDDLLEEENGRSPDANAREAAVRRMSSVAAVYPAQTPEEYRNELILRADELQKEGQSNPAFEKHDEDLDGVTDCK